MAFDKVSRDVLWIKLHEKGINPKLIYILSGYYRSSVTIVDKGHTFSEKNSNQQM